MLFGYLFSCRKEVSTHGLTLKQKKFADEYIISGNAYKSALNAGYSENYAKGNVVKLLENVSVKKYIDERLADLESEKIAKQEEVLQYLSSVMRGEQTEQTLKSCGAEWGQEITDIEVGAKDRIKAAELLGKRYGMWTDKQDVNITIPTFIDDLPESD